MNSDSDETKLTIGSISNDLFRVATLSQRQSMVGAKRFLVEAKKWASSLDHKSVPSYISEIAIEVKKRDDNDLSLESAEEYLMYAVILQNYALHLK